MISELVVRASHDWLTARDFLTVAAGGGEPDGLAAAAGAAALAAAMLRAGLVVPGDIVAGRHVPWDGPADDWDSRIAAHWLAEPERSGSDGFVWFEPTELALGLARALGAPSADCVGLPSYPGSWTMRPDGIKVGLRRASARGGAVIDVLHPDGTEEKVVTGVAVSAAAVAVPRDEVDEVLTRAADDWVWAASIFDAACVWAGDGSQDANGSSTEDAPGNLPQGPTSEPAQDPTERAVALLGLLLREGLLRPGRIAFGRFRPWPCSTEEAIERVAAHWRSLPYRLGTLDFFVWFDVTDLGLERLDRFDRTRAAPEVATRSGDGPTSLRAEPPDDGLGS
ncbi:hypothetical protein N865_21650 [Intrasporangium oryzae NRRL B-24470]|uniref:Uncharacterized protein n=1 Tax=Intrasporangium oryzae NRRL B-24470 TaxID=1386089 RepID=W9G4D6_9MICO|nr:hypothetical protein [Intrasporangium oryzae]EWS99652.1 hypothetical protein N865_21650 [Intrasporangium oryzae NRRL B-24470]